MSGQLRCYCCVHYGGMGSRSGCVISSKLIWSKGAGDSPGSLMSDSRKISMKDVLHLLSADTNPIYPRYEVTLCLHMAWTASPRSTLTEIKTRTCRPSFSRQLFMSSETCRYIHITQGFKGRLTHYLKKE